ncbi:MAG: glycoside hydrolase family 66 protein [Anaerolineae bacterium]
MLAVDTVIEVTPDKAFYRPGETVTLAVTAAQGARVEATIRYLSEAVETLDAPLEGGQASLSWTPPETTPRGYGVDLRLLDAGGNVLTTTSAAFDVLDHWIQAPRYGFFSDYTPQRADDDSTVNWLLSHHINGLQFYDWQYRWEDLLPDGDAFTDGMGRPLSMATVRHLIDLVHARQIAAMPYTAIYGASMGFYQQHRDWALVSASGDLFTLGDFIAILDPTPGSPWNTHLLAEFADVLDHTAFDGIHIDQYGSPKIAFDAAGNRVDMVEVFPQFIDQTAELVREKRGDDGVVIFNAVGNYPVETVAPSQQNVVYIEVWSPYNDYADLNRLVANAEQWGGGKPVIIAAYIPPDRAINWQLSNAVIFASGAYHLETGEPHSMLADAYFPKYGTLDSANEPLLQRYYDFLVRYENVLSLNTVAAAYERVTALDLGDLRTRGIRAKDRVLPIVRAGDGFEVYSLVNFIGIDASDWNQPTNVPPTAQKNVSVSIDVTRSVKRVWAASPDDASTMEAAEIAYTVEDGVLSLTLPRLNYWSMIVVEYDDER